MDRTRDRPPGFQKENQPHRYPHCGARSNRPNPPVGPMVHASYASTKTLVCWVEKVVVPCGRQFLTGAEQIRGMDNWRDWSQATPDSPASISGGRLITDPPRSCPVARLPYERLAVIDGSARSPRSERGRAILRHHSAYPNFVPISPTLTLVTQTYAGNGVYVQFTVVSLASTLPLCSCRVRVSRADAPCQMRLAFP